MEENSRQGFTLIELSIVLVIIGLVVGGVLVGQDLISVAATRAQIAQIEKYQTAVNTFRVKYGGLPGDLSTAAQFGNSPRGTLKGEGDGNGILESWNASIGSGPCGTIPWGFYQGGGETGLFWSDLGQAGLIDSNLNTATYQILAASVPATQIYLYLPPAKLSNANYIYVWSGIMYDNACNEILSGNENYFSIAGAPAFFDGYLLDSKYALTVKQAYDIDQKVDDGLPETGRIIAVRASGVALYVGGDWGPTDISTLIPSSATSCYDNNNVGTNQKNYSLSQNRGAGINCALSFQFQ